MTRHLIQSLRFSACETDTVKECLCRLAVRINIGISLKQLLRETSEVKVAGFSMLHG